MSHRLLTLRHVGSQRLIPIVVPTVFGRNDVYYHYGETDARADRLHGVTDGLAELNYIQISSDPKVSRTHGMISPGLPAVSDLNSTNGTFVNSEPLEGSYGQVGPAREVGQGDSIGVGNQEFVVLCEVIDDATYTSRLRAKRWGLVASDAERHGRGQRTASFLRERKGCRTQHVSGWSALIQGLYGLQSIDPDGVFVLALCAGVNGPQLVFDGEEHPLGHLLHILANVPGRKVLALDLDGDPSLCEQRFRDIAFTDTVLLTCPGAVRLDEPLEGTLHTTNLDGLSQSLSGDGVRGSYDDLVDGIDALLPADRNTLQVSWLAGYEGRLRLEFGGREAGEGNAISHSLRTGSTTFRF